MKSLKQRFLDKVEETETCHNWTSHIQPNGYGQFNVKNKAQYAHRVAYELHKGPIPEGYYVLHTCDNRKCVNPEHLFIGSFQDNINDMVNKKRQAHGEKNGHAKLTSGQVKEIRELNLKQKEISEIYNISQPLVSMIKSKRIWKYI